MSSPFLIWILKIGFTVLGLLFSCTGLYVIRKYKLTTYNTIGLLGLTVSQICCLIYCCINNTVMMVFYRTDYVGRANSIEELYYWMLPNYYRQIDSFLLWTIQLGFIFAVTLISSNQLICAMAPVKYKLYLKNKTVKFQVLMTWILSVLLGITGTLLSKQILYSIGIALFIVNIIVFITTSLIIAFKYGTKNSRSSLNTSYMNIKFKQLFLASNLILLNFITFYMIPWVIIMTIVIPLNTESDYMRFEMIRLVILIGYNLNPIIYVYGKSPFRKMINRTFCRCFKRNERSEASQVGERRVTTIYLAPRRKTLRPLELFQCNRTKVNSVHLNQR